MALHIGHGGVGGRAWGEVVEMYLSCLTLEVVMTQLGKPSRGERGQRWVPEPVGEKLQEGFSPNWRKEGVGWRRHFPQLSENAVPGSSTEEQLRDA